VRVLRDDTADDVDQARLAAASGLSRARVGCGVRDAWLERAVRFVLADFDSSSAPQSMPRTHVSRSASKITARADGRSHHGRRDAVRRLNRLNHCEELFTLYQCDIAQGGCHVMDQLVVG
jgi:hypothetical protein